MKKKLLSLLLVFIIMMGVFTATPYNVLAAISDDVMIGYNEEDEGSYGVAYLSDGTCSINNYQGSGGDIKIPSSLYGRTVTNISRRAFKDCVSLTSINIPDTVTGISSYAFEGCTNLESIIIPKSVIGCDWTMFAGCENLKKISIDANNTVYDSRENCNAIIKTETNELIVGCQNSVIPDSVTSIGINSFYECTSLKGITIGNNVTNIGRCAFNSCSNLTYITMGSHVDIIDEFAFGGCTSLVSISIPDSVTSIKRGAFRNCTNLKNVFIGESVSLIASDTFKDCINLKSIIVDKYNPVYDSRENCNAIIKTETNEFIVGCQSTVIPDSVSIIGSYAFDGCENLTVITIPDSVTEIRGYAFANCTGLVTVNFGNCVRYISANAFESCKSLTDITIPDSTTTIGDEAFLNCSNLIKLTIPDNTSIGYGAFSGTAWYNSQPNGLVYIGKVAYCIKGNCTNNVEIKPGTIGIAKKAFYNCTNLLSVCIPESITYVNMDSFSGCVNLSSVKISNLNKWLEIRFNSNKSISNPLYMAHNLYLNDKLVTNLIIPDGVESICKEAFIGCTSITSVAIPDSVTDIGGVAFEYCSNLKNLSIGNSVESIGNSAFYGCKSLENLNIPNSITNIGSSAFRDCINLKSITIPSSVTNIGSYAFGYYYNDNHESVKLDNFTIKGNKNSAAEHYANDNGFTFIDIQSLKNISDCSISLSSNSYTYDGLAKKPSVTIKNDSKILVEGTDYSLSYQNNTNVGNATITIIGKGSYSGSVTKHFSIKAKSIATTTVTLSQSSYTYDGTEKNPTVTVKDGTIILSSGTDYTVSYSNNKNVGTATVTISGKGNYTGTSSKNFTILESPKTNLSTCTITLSRSSYTYDGAEKKPIVTVKDDSKILTIDTDYSVTYKNNINVGTATVTITGKGSYTGTVTKYFTINAAAKTNISICTVTLSQTSYTYDGKEKKPTVTVKNGTITLTNGTDYSMTYKNNTNIGTASVTISGKGNYTGTLTKNFTIIAAKKAFIWGQDNWNFNNSTTYFNKSTYRNQISTSYLNTLKNNLTNSEYQTVFVREGGAWLDDTWGGSCYGMSSLALLSNQGLVPYSKYKSGATKLYNLSYPKIDNNISSLVTYYQMLQVKSVIQQQYRTVPYKSNEANINEIINQLNNNSTVLIGFQKSGWGGHAILATGYEYGSWTWNKIAYQGCIKICDPNCSKSYNSSYNIYYNTQTYNWTIPHYSNMTSTSGAKFNYIGADASDINSGGYLSGTSTNTVNDFVARIDATAIADNRSVTKVVESNGNYISQNTSPGDIIEDYSYILGNESEGTIGYNLYDANASYKVSQDNAQKLQLGIDYERCNLYGGSAAGKSVLFDESGFIEVKGETAEYNMEMTFDEDYPTEWFSIRIVGTGANVASLKKSNDGYILSSDNLNEVSIEANNREDTAKATLSTGYDSVFIYETSETTIGIKVDKDNNGTYETDLVLKGDSDGNRNIEITDATFIQRYLNKTATPYSKDQLLYGDVDNSGELEIIDVTAIQYYLVKLKTPYRIGILID